MSEFGPGSIPSPKPGPYRGPRPGNQEAVKPSEDAVALLEAAFAAPSGTVPDALPAQPVSAAEAADAELVAIESKVVVDPELGEAPVYPEFPVDRKEVTTPKRSGDISHQEYHAQRPSEGVYRDASNRPQNTNGGFASQESYDAQVGTNDPNAASEHYDEIMGLNEAQSATPERPAYEKMDIDQLAFASAKAAMTGDKFVTDEIREAYAEPFEEEYTRPGGTLSLEDYEAALARFDRLVGIATEYEKAKDPEHSALVDATVARVEKGPTIGDKLKGWWGKHKESIKNVFRPEFWGERFTAAGNKLQEASTWALNLGVNPEDTDEEKDKKRNKNRVLFIAGGTALAVGTIAAAYGIGVAVGNNGHHAAEAVNSGAGQGGGGGNTLSAHDQAIADALNPNSAAAKEAASAAEAAAKAQEAARQAAEVAPIAGGFTITGGEGGEQLFSSLNIDPAKWVNHAAQLQRDFPKDFYVMDDGGIGLMQKGLLSDGARNAITAIGRG